MSIGLAVRRLLPTDAEDFRHIRLAALQTAPEAFGSTFSAESGRTIESFIEGLETSHVVGAYRDSTIVGMIGLKRESGARMDHKAFVWGFFVEPGARGCGTGALLIEAALAAARRMVEQVTLTVVADNTSAIRLYERFGFSRYGTEPRALKTADGYADEALMVLIFERA